MGNHNQIRFKVQWVTFVLLLSLSDTCLLAQRVYHMNVDNGLCTNSLTDLTRDHNGDMWIGSYSGLMKFSGTNIKCITKVGSDHDAISGPEMHSVCEDHCGYIWIGTTAGLNKIDPVTFEVLQYPIRSPFAGSSSVGYIYAVFADRHDYIWFSTDVALFKMDINTGLYHVVPVKKDKDGVPHHLVSYNGFLEDDNGLWISTGAGMAYFEYKTQLFYHRYHNPFGKSIFNVTKSTSGMHSDIDCDSKGRIWFVLEHQYLASYDILGDEIDTFKIQTPPGTWNCCYSISVDAMENIWVGTRHGGILILSTTAKSFTSLRSIGINRFIQSDYIYAIERGSDGQMFVAHDNGLDIIDLYDLSLQEIKLSGRDDFLNLKYQSGDISFDEQEQSVFIPFYKFGFFRYGLANGHIASFDISSQQEVASPLIHLQNGKSYIAAGRNLHAVMIQDEGVMYSGAKLLPDTISATHGEVVWCYVESPESTYIKKSSGKIFHIQDTELEVLQGHGFKANICLSPDSQFMSYITPQLNLVRRNLKLLQDDTILLQQYLEQRNFSFSNPRHMVDDGKAVWVTGQNGLLRMDYPEHRLHTYEFGKGLSHSFTFSLVLDAHQNVWVGSLGGIDRYDQSSDRFVSVYKVKGNTYMDAFGSACCSRAGELFFHFGNKLIRIQPDQKEPLPAEKRIIRWHEVLVNGQNIDWQAPGKLSNLRHDENRLTFIYDMLIFDNSDMISFYYRLDGKEWISHGQRNEVNLDGLASGRHTLELRGSVGSQSNTTKTLSMAFRIRPPWWKEWWFLALVLLVFMVVIWRWFRGRLEKFQQELSVARQIADLESKALKAQMNPHFVFNSLNAIQECIVTGKIEEAYTYLSQFSRLLRLVLEHSDVAEVTLHEEIEVLSLFVSLEKLRFRNDMQYRMDIEEGLDQEEIRIPPMLIQPHLENAIWHGLRNKEGEKVLKLSMTEINPGYLTVMIEDNGIGRVQAEVLRQGRLGGNKHKSKGKQLSGNRMELLKNTYPLASMSILDLYHEDGRAAGTRVQLVIPILDVGAKIKTEA